MVGLVHLDPILLAIRGNPADLWTAMLYMAGIVVMVGVAVAVIAAIRRWNKDGVEVESSGLTLNQVRQMQANGLLTSQEYDQLKRVILDKTPANSGG